MNPRKQIVKPRKQIVKKAAEPNPAQPVANKVVRTAEGMRDMLFEEMDALRAGTSTASRARSLATLANAALQSVVVEIEYHKYVVATDESAPALARLGGLPLGSSAPKLHS